MQNNKIIAITLGPICRTTGNVKSTKALWASSYFFSYLAKNLIAPFAERKFILPIVSKNTTSLWQNGDGIGRFPDRYIFYSEEGDFEELKKRTEKVIGDLSSEIATFFYLTNDSGKISGDEDNVKKELLSSVESFLKNYLKVYFFEKQCTSGNVVEECNAVLDLMELQDTYNLSESENYLTKLFEHKELRNSFLVTDAFGHNDEKQLFNALDQIAEQELKEDNQKGTDKLIERKAYHNYIAIISADGDNMSNTIKALLGKEDNVSYKGASVQVLSTQLLNFGERIVELSLENEIEVDEEKATVAWEYKARIVFLGGDDLLIFAPVMYKGKTVFDFINKISGIFDEKMELFGETKPTISFGVSINYVKFPMSEALQISRDMLDLAKTETEYRNKNSVAFSLQKHSGHSNIGVYTKGETRNIFRTFIELVRLYKSDDSKILSSITYWIANNKTMLGYLLTLGENREIRIKNYFENSFNESVHKDLDGFYTKLVEFLVQAQQVSENPIDLLHTSLRFIHFIKTKSDE